VVLEMPVAKRFRFEVAPAAASDGHRGCPICLCRRGTELHRQKFALGLDSPLPSEYTVLACSACAFVYANTTVGQAAYDRYYEESSAYDDPTVSTGSGFGGLDKVRLEDTATIITKLATTLQLKDRIVDVGCAGGGLLQILRERGFSDLSGIDPSQVCVDRVRSAGFAGTKANLADLQQLSDPGAYSLVILSHVVEHVWDLRSSMRQVLSLLKADGIIYMEVPDARRYCRVGFPPYYFFDCEHINHFDADSLRNLATTIGVQVVAHGERDIAVGNGKQYPAVWVALTRTVTAEPRLVPSINLRESVAAYIAESAASIRFGRLEDLATTGRPVVLWGAGSHAQRLLAQSPLARCAIVAIVDRNSSKQGRQFCGLRISAPETVLASLDRDAVVVIASVLHAEEICSEIRARGLLNEVVLEN